MNIITESINSENKLYAILIGDELNVYDDNEYQVYNVYEETHFKLNLKSNSDYKYMWFTPINLDNNYVLTYCNEKFVNNLNFNKNVLNNIKFIYLINENIVIRIKLYHITYDSLPNNIIILE